MSVSTLARLATLALIFALLSQPAIAQEVVAESLLDSSDQELLVQEVMRAKSRVAELEEQLQDTRRDLEATRTAAEQARSRADEAMAEKEKVVEKLVTVYNEEQGLRGSIDRLEAANADLEAEISKQTAENEHQREQIAALAETLDTGRMAVADAERTSLALKTSGANADEALIQVTRERDKFMGQLQEMTTLLSRQDVEVKTLTADRDRLGRDLEAAEARAQTLTERLEGLNSGRNELNNEATDLRIRVQELSASEAELASKLKQSEEARIGLETRINRESTASVTLTDQVTELRTDLAQTRAGLDDATADNQALSAQLQTLTTEHADLTEQNQSLLARSEEVSKARGDIETSYRQAATEAESLRAALNQSTDDASAAQTLAGSLGSQNTELEKNLAGARAENETLAAKLREAEGMSDTVSSDADDLRRSLVAAEENLAAEIEKSQFLERRIEDNTNEVLALQNELQAAREEATTATASQQDLEQELSQRLSTRTDAEKQLRVAEMVREAVEQMLRQTEDKLAVERRENEMLREQLAARGVPPARAQVVAPVPVPVPAPEMASAELAPPTPAEDPEPMEAPAPPLPPAVAATPTVEISKLLVTLDPASDATGDRFMIGDKIYVVLRYSLQGIDADASRSIALRVLDPNGRPVDFLSVTRDLEAQNGTFSATLESVLPASLPTGSYTLITELVGGDLQDRRALRFAVSAP